MKGSVIKFLKLIFELEAFISAPDSTRDSTTSR